MPLPIEDKLVIAVACSAIFELLKSERGHETDEHITSENMNIEKARRYIISLLNREYASDAGNELNSVLPKMRPLNPQYLTKKQTVFQKVAAFFEKFKGVGGSINKG